MKANKKIAGFTLIEVLVVTLLVGVFSTILLINLRGFSTNPVILERAALGVISDIRRAQALSIAGVSFQGTSVCGYGIHYLTGGTYLIYAGGESTCGTANRNYQSVQDFSYQQIKFKEDNIEFRSSFDDVFFEPPDPKTYIDNQFSLSSSPLTITVKFKGYNCPSYCKTISVYPSGKIDLN
ncbi:MAG: prepilin-type N-terminal cleavage/methylation domain-containing protein [Candidatus Yanofskybacteria bacterium]|nr:prepilin-type N-terminal cleavage/methylation domain-containing protein [Candidatus Yanofskybacteria bacterium]